VQFLKEEGVSVEWSPPAVEEGRGLGADVNQVVVRLVSTGMAAAIAAAVRRFRKFGSRDKGKVEVEGEPPGEEDDQDQDDSEDGSAET
jgi:hypothetical protein